MIDVIPLKYGPIFKRAFSKPNIFREFVHAVTGVQVNVKRVHTEYKYPERVGNVNIQYDIFAEDEEQRIIIEIQHIKEEDFFHRFLYYHMIGIIDQVTSFDESTHCFRRQNKIKTVNGKVLSAFTKKRETSYNSRYIHGQFDLWWWSVEGG